MSDFCKHEHEVCGYTDCYCSHYHRLKDKETCGPIFTGSGSHVHFIRAETSKDDRHRHEVCCYTGPAMPASCGCGHYHYFYGVTTCDDGHTHYIKGITDIEEGY